jgi:hypothetical protein
MDEFHFGFLFLACVRAQIIGLFYVGSLGQVVGKQASRFHA